MINTIIALGGTATFGYGILRIVKERKYKNFIDRYKNRYKADPIEFEDFKTSYNLNPNRWDRYKELVMYKNNLTDSEDDAWFYFKNYKEYAKYTKWLIKHNTKRERMMFWMREDLKALSARDAIQAENIQLAIDTINANYPNIDNKFKYALEKGE